MISLGYLFIAISNYINDRQFTLLSLSSFVGISGDTFHVWFTSIFLTPPSSDPTQSTFLLFFPAQHPFHFIQILFLLI